MSGYRTRLDRRVLPRTTGVRSRTRPACILLRDPSRWGSSPHGTTTLVEKRIERGELPLEAVDAPVAICSADGILLSGSPAGLELLEACGATTGTLPIPLPEALWSAIEESDPAVPATWHGTGGRSLGCSRHRLGKEHVLLTMREITDRQHDLTRRLHQQRLETVGQLMATIAHDLRTPLASLVLEVESAWEQRHELSGAALERMLRSVSIAAERLTNSVDSLLEYSRVGPAELKPISVESVLERVQGLVRPIVRDRRHELIIEAEADLPPAQANALVLEQALVNLIVNAAEADAGPLRIAVRCTTFERPLAGPSVPSGPLPLARGLRIDVQDDGPGIPENLHSRVFDPFYTTKADGTGLGLPMAREAMLACGGDLRVRPNRHGACFSIWVPRA